MKNHFLFTIFTTLAILTLALPQPTRALAQVGTAASAPAVQAATPTPLPQPTAATPLKEECISLEQETPQRSGPFGRLGYQSGYALLGKYR